MNTDALLIQLAEQDRIEALPGVLEAVIGGDHEALLEVIVDPVVMETYSVQYGELFSLVSNNNMLVAAGAMDTGAGRLVLKVPGAIAGGLFFATLLTLALTPCLLVLGDGVLVWIRALPSRAANIFVSIKRIVNSRGRLIMGQ